jgi:hypothetical protein
MPAVVIFGDAPLPTTGSMGFSAPPPLLFFLDAALLFFLPPPAALPPAALPQEHFEAFFSGMNRIYCVRREFQKNDGSFERMNELLHILHTNPTQ